MSYRSSIEETIENLKNYLGDLIWDSVDLDMKIKLEQNNNSEIVNELKNLRYYEQCIRFILAQEYDKLKML